MLLGFHLSDNEKTYRHLGSFSVFLVNVDLLIVSIWLFLWVLVVVKQSILTLDWCLLSVQFVNY